MSELEIIKSPIPIIWLDTSVILDMAKLKKTPDKLEDIQYRRISSLYQKIFDVSRQGKVICPLAEQESEIWIDRKVGLDVILSLGLGIECVSQKEIQDIQIQNAMIGYLDEKNKVIFSYEDAFPYEPVDELKKILQQPYFVTVQTEQVSLGSEYHKNKNEKDLTAWNKIREKNIKEKTCFNKQLQREFDCHLKEHVKSTKNSMDSDYISGNESLYYSDLKGFEFVWNILQKKRKSSKTFISFLSSEYYKACPYTYLMCYLIAKKLTDPQPVKPGDLWDIQHTSTMMPYSDLFITDKDMSTFLNKEGFGEKYSCEIMYIGNTSGIDTFFDKIINEN